MSERARGSSCEQMCNRLGMEFGDGQDSKLPRQIFVIFSQLSPSAMLPMITLAGIRVPLIQGSP
jgi:hypothetical protein